MSRCLEMVKEKKKKRKLEMHCPLFHQPHSYWFFFQNMVQKSPYPRSLQAFLGWISNSLPFAHTALCTFLYYNTYHMYCNFLSSYPSVLLPPTHWAQLPGAATVSSWTSIPSTWQRAWQFVCPRCFMNEWMNQPSLKVIHYQWILSFIGHKNHLELLAKNAVFQGTP